MMLAVRTKKVVGVFCLGALVCCAALLGYSHSGLLAAERQFMPSLSSLATPHQREVTFRLLGSSGAFRPHWRVVYREVAVTDTEYIDPAISVDLLGRIADTESKEVWSAVA